MSVTVSGSLNGPIFGVFLIGFFLPNCNLKGVWTGFIGSSVFMLWLTIGSMLYKNPTKLLSFSAAECLDLNSSSLNVTNFHETIPPYNGTNTKTV
ncbi:Sodium/iodide cotransporter [Armadillidium vulgare]|nr:Sodium/iodide cotransporter [Armadillidium vulgare]